MLFEICTHKCVYKNLNLNIIFILKIPAAVVDGYLFCYRVPQPAGLKFHNFLTLILSIKTHMPCAILRSFVFHPEHRNNVKLNLLISYFRQTDSIRSKSDINIEIFDHLYEEIDHDLKVICV